MLNNRLGHKQALFTFVFGMGVLPCALALEDEKQYFIQPFGGYSFAASNFKVEDSLNNSQNRLRVKESNHYGLALGVNTFDPGNMYFLYSRMDTDLGYSSQQNQIISPLTIDYFHLGGSLFYPYDHFHNYVTVTTGLTQFRPSNAFSNETRFSMGFGLGTEYLFTDYFSLTGDIRAFATIVDSNNDFLCETSQCNLRINAEVFLQGQVNLGVKFTF